MKKEIVSIVLARSAAPFPGAAEECVYYLSNQVRYENRKIISHKKGRTSISNVRYYFLDCLLFDLPSTTLSEERQNGRDRRVEG